MTTALSLGLDKSTWNRVHFGDVIQNVSDRIDDPATAGVDRYVGLEHLDAGSMTVTRWGTPDQVNAQKLRFQSGDVIFGRRRAYQKKVSRAHFDGICSAHALVLRAIPGQIDPDFLPVFLSSDYFLARAIAISVGSLSPTVNWRDLKVQEFLLPPIEQQKRIAALFWAMEGHRLSLKRLLAALKVDESSDGIGRALFEALSVAWPSVRFSEAIKVSSGAFLPAKKMQEGDVPVYGGNGISGYHNAANNAEPVVLVGRVGAYCGVVHHTTGPAWVTDNALVVKRAEGYEDDFLTSVLRYARLNQYASQTAQPAVSGVGLAEAPLARPDGTEQRKYLDQRAVVQFAVTAAEAEFTSLTVLRSSLLADACGGSR